jgi:uncharacterized FlgJ-related protein
MKKLLVGALCAFNLVLNAQSEKFIGDLPMIDSFISFDKISNKHNAIQQSIYGDGVVYIANFNYTKNINNKNISYIKTVMQSCLDVEYLYSIPSEIVLAHAILQSNSGTSYLSIEHKNHFNLKYWHTDNENYNIFKGSYIEYQCVAHSFIDFGWFLFEVTKENKYLNADYFDIISDIWCDTKAQKKSYKRKLKKIIKKYKLTEIKDISALYSTPTK